MTQLGEQIKKDFPIFKQPMNGQQLVFLDSGASSQKPQIVIDAVKECYEKCYANVHRGIYGLSEKASEVYEQVREKVVDFIHADNCREIIFTKNTTESINLVAFTWGQQNITAGDEIIVTEMEHHANLLPWRILAENKKAKVKYLPASENYRLDINQLDSLITSKTKLIAVTHMSNVLGTINPVKDIITRAHGKNIKVMIDGAQAVPHFPVNVKELEADFYAFSPHKMLGPSGVGVLYVKEEILNTMKPFLTGGNMIASVTFTDTEWNDLPFKFEAGTPNIEGVVGFGAAIDYLQNIGMENIFAHEQEVTKKALEELQQVEGLTLYGPPETNDRGAVFSFIINDIHAHDMASLLDEQGVAIRAGHHCAQPLHQKLGVEATTRASFYLYNTLDDITALINSLNKAKEVFGI